MPTIGITGVTFTKVAREWRCKYAFDAEGGPANSQALKACQTLLGARPRRAGPAPAPPRPRPRPAPRRPPPPPDAPRTRPPPPPPAAAEEYLPKLKALPNAEVTRVVCGGCGDFKVIVNQPEADYGKWAEADHAPEKEFIEKLSAIEGTSFVETQTFTMELM